MSIKKKKAGAVPIFPERWQELAKDEKRLVEATREYRYSNPTATLVESSRLVRNFNRKFKEAWGRN